MTGLLALLVYRLRAAAYGAGVRIRRPLSDKLGIVGFVLGVAGIAITLQYGWLLDLVRVLDVRRPVVAAGAAVVLLALLWALVRYLGSLSRIMDIAASDAEAARRIREDMRAGMRNTAAYDALVRLYDDEVAAADARLAARGHPQGFALVRTPPPASIPYAAVVLPLAGERSLDDLVGRIVERPPVPRDRLRLTEPRQALMRAWRRTGNAARSALGDEAGDNYVLDRIRVVAAADGPAIVVDVGVGTYGEIVRTCDALVNEFALHAFVAGPTVASLRPRHLLATLPWRRATHRRSTRPGDLFLAPRDRAAGLGVALATVLERDATVVALGMRSAEVGTYPDCLHLVPAGMCNTHGTERMAGTAAATVPDWYLATTMKSEFLEEWYDDQELESGRIVDWNGYVQQHWTARVGAAEPSLTGIAYDLLNLRPEVCGAVAVDRYGERLCWEYINGRPHEEPTLDRAVRIPRQEIVQSAAAALALAGRRAGTR